jgi:hypothetical protein
MKVAVANPGGFHLYQNFTRAWRRQLRRLN